MRFSTPLRPRFFHRPFKGLQLVRRSRVPNLNLFVDSILVCKICFNLSRMLKNKFK